MGNTLTIEIKDNKARRLLKSLEEVKLISDSNIKWTPKKRKQAKNFLSAYAQAKLAEQGKIKLNTAQSLINEL